MIPLLSLIACGGPSDEVAPPQVADARSDEIPELDTPALMRRISLDVRGVPPTLAEYRRGIDDPGQLDALIDEWLADDGFAERVVALYSEIYLTKTQSFPFDSYSLNVDDPAAFEKSLGEEPLRILARIAEEDLPYTELVVGDWTMANDVLASAFPLDVPGTGTDWRVATYTDGRPSAGVLSTTGMMWRYTSSDSNANRKRANQTSRILLCNDYLTRPVDFDRNINLLDEEAVLDALQTNPACVSCHVSLDPLASYFYGFWWLREDSAIDAAVYHPDRERMWEEVTGVAPAYYGEPGNSLRDLGNQIAADPRFVECATEQAFEVLMRRDVSLEDFTALTAHREAFLQGDLTVRALFRSILADPAYRAANTSDPVASSLKLASPDLLASQVEALTGYDWTYGGYDMMATDVQGVRTLAGGADGYEVTSIARTPNATSILVQQRLAEQSVRHMLDTDPDKLLSGIQLDNEPTPQQLADLFLTVLGQEVEHESEEVTGLLELWQQIREIDGDGEGAWAGILYALMRDPTFVLY